MERFEIEIWSFSLSLQFLLNCKSLSILSIIIDILILSSNFNIIYREFK